MATDWSYNIAFFIFLIGIPIYISFVLWALMDSPQVSYCLADAFCTVQNQCSIITIPFAAFLVVHSIKYDFFPSVILHMKNVRNLWIRLCKKIIKNAFIISFYLLICTTLIGIQFGRFNNNWIEENSAASNLLHTQVPHNGNVWEILFVFTIMTFLTIVFFGMLIALLWWIFGTPLIGYVIIILLIKLELGMQPAAIHLFFLKVNMNPYVIYWLGVSYYNLVVYPLILIIGLFLMGLFIRKKDFL
ncbi:hypothetical protein SAMN05421659_12016 [[Clostridium] fimetarium]|uniref:ABC-2 family transporter protein n=2 Tax=[Clostridium] fimetarium TaxID=99656 RepID=A0A1I0RPA4_9FIRM|nr:hypothetical protein SAMN05421659_12016 [[Clostridium] fimetarium]